MRDSRVGPKRAALLALALALALASVVGACGAEPVVNRCGEAKREFARTVDEIAEVSAALEQEPTVTRIERGVALSEMQLLLGRLQESAEDIERYCR